MLRGARVLPIMQQNINYIQYEQPHPHGTGSLTQESALSSNVYLPIKGLEDLLNLKVFQILHNLTMKFYFCRAQNLGYLKTETKTDFQQVN